MADLLSSLLKEVDAARSVVQGISSVAKVAAAEAYLQAAEEAISHIRLVVQNNPAKTLDEIMARPDIRQAIEYPLAQAHLIASQAIAAGWADGTQAGLEHAKRSLGRLGVEAPGTASPDVTYLKAVQADLTRNTTSAPSSILEIARSTEDRGTIPEMLRRRYRELSRRAALGADVAVTRAASQTAAREFALAGVKKVWITSFSKNTCGACAALHGTVLAAGDLYDHAQTYADTQLGVYGDLLSPPRHPNCACQLVPWGGYVGPLGKLVGFAAHWWNKLRKGGAGE